MDNHSKPTKDRRSTHSVSRLTATKEGYGALNISRWHEPEEALWSAHEAVSGPLFDLLFVTL
jgi:hypothetical protein